MTYLRTLLMCICVLLFNFGGAIARAQTTDRVGLVANSVSFDPNTGILIAQGDVRILSQGNIILTERVIYDQRNKRLTIPGDMEITQADGTIIRATGADISQDLKSGLIKGATLIIDNQFQLTSQETQRTDGRFTVLSNTVASTCYVCNKNSVPFWQIRSRKTIHDSISKRIYFERATLDFLGVPIFYAPKLRVPDPTVDRATGVLFPEFSQSSTLGYGFKLPYYIVLGDHADATITPFYSTKGGLVLEGEYRQNLRNGAITANGAIAYDDTVSSKELRAFLQADAEYALGGGYRLDLGLDIASDQTFLAQYNYGTQDRLTSFATISRTRPNSYLSVGASRIQSLRTNEVDTEIPIVFPEIYARKTVRDTIIGGRIGFSAQSVTLLRENDNSFFRLGGGVDWQKDWQFSNGMLARVVTEANANFYSTKNHIDYGTTTGNSTQSLIGAELRWPWSKSSGGATHVIEPIIQVAWATSNTVGTINEDSTQVEFEDTNLFSFNRFPGDDQRETGQWANVGVHYSRYDPSGWNMGVSIGRVFRKSGNADQFNSVNSAGLQGTNSDYVSLLSFSLPNRLDFVNRTLISDNLTVSKNETRLRYTNEAWQTAVNYTWLDEESVSSTSEFQHEVGLKLEYTPEGYWSYGAEWRENLQSGQPIEGTFKAKYENECVAINFSVSRQYAASGIVEPDTQYGLSVELIGLGSKGSGKVKKQRCNG